MFLLMSTACSGMILCSIFQWPLEIASILLAKDNWGKSFIEVEVSG